MAISLPFDLTKKSIIVLSGHTKDCQLYKPCFIYATGINKYVKEHNYFTPIENQPFPLATNNNELTNNIKNFTMNKYIGKVKNHRIHIG